MGKLIKNHWARLIILTAAALKPIPALQIINLVLGIVGLAYEWPLSFIAGSGVHRSIEARLIIYPLSALCALLIYQGTNSGLYYIVGMIAYFWAYSEGETVCPEPWTLPKRGSSARGRV
ncbi:hypothetical protein K491DRAFT_704241 [Lophiostoma macrostomum CBS 122681]|uniref:DUF7727 domain-containing protein n=1 Tax=Lophiostoma macrostomum CBS 122681 TaxID=1314788 RepID=A0A6A6T8G4_9PLEO|nr:hypothetical protein K491DRAFT_704241 [Lophiostoma macrostomum CBS 122681]